MRIAKRVRSEWRDRIPAIVHVDGTARVQTVKEATNPMLYRLLREFEALTGVPVLINTSFNVKGGPIVETPEDAMACFPTTGIDHLILQQADLEERAAPDHRAAGRRLQRRRRHGDGERKAHVKHQEVPTASGGN
jgi:carbamoyltransferase